MHCLRVSHVLARVLGNVRNFDDARMQVGKIDSGTTRLILMIMTDANEEVQLRQILVEAEITPPRYQFMSTAVTMLVEDPSAYDAFPRWKCTSAGRKSMKSLQLVPTTRRFM
eukprot:6472009-Amphidinium_carterae.1